MYPMNDGWDFDLWTHNLIRSPRPNCLPLLIESFNANRFSMDIDVDRGQRVGNSWRTYLRKLNNGKIRETENPKAVHFKYPGLSLSHYDREGNPNIVTFMRYLIDLRSCGLNIPCDGKDSYFCDWPTLKENNLSFIASSTLTFSRAFYEQQFTRSPLDASLSLGRVGNTSCSLLTSIKAPGSQDPLVSQNLMMVIVDKVTRKSKKLPNWFVTKYKGKDLFREHIRVNTFSKPEETFHYQTQVTWFDTDKNDHTNYASYVQYAINGIRNALLLKEEASIHPTGNEESDLRKENMRQAELCLKYISSKIMRNGLSCLKIFFLKESLQGDVLDIHLWQKEGHELNVCCFVESGGQNLCQLELEYFSPISRL